MSKYIVDSSLMTGIADNIRLKTGEEGNLVFPAGFNAAIESLPSIEDMRDIKDKVDDIKDIFDSNESEIDKTITTPADVASFSDGADDIPMALKVAVEPMQDLHGQENPYPAGGGKNKWSEGNQTVEAYKVVAIDIPVGEWTFSALVTSTTELNHAILFKENADGTGNTVGATTIRNGTGRISNSFGVTSPAKSVALYAATAWNESQGQTTTYTDIQLESSLSATAYAPYSNICPISGWTGAKVWDDPVYAGTIRLNQIFPLKNGEYMGTNFTVSFDGAGCMTVDVAETASSTNANNMSSIGAGTWIKGHIYAFIGGAHGISLRLKWFGKDIDSVFRVDNPIYNNLAIVFTNLAVGVYKVYPMIIDLTAMFGEAKAEEILSLGSVVGAEYVKSLLPKEYYPYNIDGTETCISAVNGNPYRHIEVTFPSSAGTVYGGTLTINQDGSGTLVVDRAKITFDGTQTVGLANWRVNSNSVGWLYARSLTPDIKQAPSTDDAPNIISDVLKTVKYSGSEGIYGCSIDCISSVWNSNDWGIAMRSTDTSLTTASAINAWLAQNPVTAVYELATPVTYELTDLEVIETLKGINNVWADTGKINEVEYSADSQLCITNKLNELDSLLSTYTETQE